MPGAWDVEHMTAFSGEDLSLIRKDKSFLAIMSLVSDLVFEGRKSRHRLYIMASKNPQISLLLDALMQTGAERHCSILKACLSSYFED